MPAPTDVSPPSITCPRCGRTSYHPKDVEFRYCGACGFHDDLDRGRPAPGDMDAIELLRVIARSHAEHLAICKSHARVHLPFDPASAWLVFADHMGKHRETALHPALPYGWALFDKLLPHAVDPDWIGFVAEVSSRRVKLSEMASWWRRRPSPASAMEALIEGFR